MKTALLLFSVITLFAASDSNTVFPKHTPEEAKMIADSLYQRLVEGEDFCVLAYQYSEDPGSKNKCGLVGWERKGMLAKEYEEVAYRMRSNDISEPVRTQFGYHIIQLLGRHALKCNTRHILIQCPPEQNK